MTSPPLAALLTNLGGPETDAGPAASQPTAASGADPSDPSAAAVQDFEVVLQAMLGGVDPTADADAAPADSEPSTSTHQKHGKAKEQDDPGQPKEADNAAVVAALGAPVVMPLEVPAPAPAPAVAQDDSNSDAASAGSSQAAPAPSALPTAAPPQVDASATVAAQAASAATPPPDASTDAVPVADPADSSTAVEDSTPAATTSPADRAGADQKSSSPSELAFAARLTGPAASSQAGAAHRPERHLALPPEIRTSQAEPDAQGSAKSPATAASTETAASAVVAKPEAVTASETSQNPGTGSVASTKSDSAALPGPAQADTGSAQQDAGSGSDTGSGQPPDPRSLQAAPASGSARNSRSSSAHQNDGDGASAAAGQNAGQAAQTATAGTAPGVTHPIGTQAPAHAEAAKTQPAAPSVDSADANSSSVDGKGGSVGELSVTLPGRSSGDGTTPKVEVRVVDRSGELQVAVHTSDSKLNNSLREDLPQLVNQLSDRGYRTEAWHPDGGTAGGDGRVIRTADTTNDSSSDPYSDSGRGGSGSSAQDRQQEQRERKQNQPEWVNTLEQTFGRSRMPSRSSL